MQRAALTLQPVISALALAAHTRAPRRLLAWLGLFLLTLITACRAEDQSKNRRGDIAPPSPGGGEKETTTTSTDPLFKLAISAKVWKANIPSLNGAVVGSFADGLVFSVPGSNVKLYEKDGERSVGGVPDYAGNADQLFLSYPVYNNGAKTTGVWHFYDPAVTSEPRFAAARPEYVENDTEHYQPVSSPDGYQVPLPDNSFLYADAKTLWYRHNNGVARLTRVGNNWTYGRYDWPTPSLTLRRWAAQAHGFIALTSDKQVLTVVEDNDNLLSYQSAAPQGVDSTNAMVGLYGKLELVFAKDGTYVRRVGQKAWEKHSERLPEAMWTADASFFHSYDEQAYVLIGRDAYMVQVKDLSNASSLDPSQSLVPESVLQIASRSCASCHVQRSNADTYSSAALFDHENLRHWQKFLKGRSAAEAKTFIIGDMCGRATDSTCRSDSGKQAILSGFIDDLLTAPQRLPSKALVDAINKSCRSCHSAGRSLADYSASKDSFDPLQSSHWQAFLTSAGTKDAAKTIVLDVMCGRAECDADMKKLIDTYITNF